MVGREEGTQITFDMIILRLRNGPKERPVWRMGEKEQPLL